MALDFRANQVRTNKLISSGSQLWVYGPSGDGTPPFEGNTSFGTGSIGTDVFFYVSGVYGSIGTANSYGATVFGGDVWVSGVFVAAGPGAFHQQVNHFGTDGWYAGFQVNAGDVRITENLFVSGNVQTAGTNKFLAGLSGSLQTLTSGDSYIIGGPGITVVTNSLGQVEISGSSGGESFFFSNTADIIAASGSLHLSGGLLVSSSAEVIGNFIQGSQCGVGGLNSHAEGSQTTVNGNASHAEGFQTLANGTWAHAEGLQSVAQGLATHAEGYQSFAGGNYSHAEGNMTTTIGDSSHAEGLQTIASGTYSHAEGIGTIASGSAQLAIGTYNKRDNTTSLFVVGNGTNDPDGDRSDVFRVDPTGVSITGSFSVFQGSVYASAGLSGSLQNLYTGESYIIGDSTINVVTNSIGQVEISASIPTPAPSYIPLAGYSTVNATEGTKAIGGTAFEFRPPDFSVGGTTPTATVEFVGYAANAQTGSLSLWSISPPSSISIFNMPISSSIPLAFSVSVMWTPAPKLYELRFSCSGSTAADLSVINNAAIKLTW